MDFQIIAAIIFIIAVGITLIINRKKVKLEKLIFPLFYMILYRTKVGLKFMDRFSKKYNELVKFLGYCFIGLGFVGMVFMFILIITNLINLIISPETTESGVALVLPFTNIPGIGYLPFLQWLLAIFILAIVHEFAHGIVARAHKVRLKSSGFAVFSVLIPIIPAAFVEPDEKQLKKKPDIVQYSVFAAGPLANIVLAGIIFLILIFIMAPIEAAITKPTGFSFNVMNETVPAGQAGIEDRMVITKFNDKNVTDATEFINHMYYCSKSGETIFLGNETHQYGIITENINGRPMIGVTDIQNEVRVKEKFLWMKGIFYWKFSFLKWLALFNLFIGLFNLLPLGIVDGGRMIKITLERITRKERARKIFFFISALLLFSILFGLIVQYVGNPLLLFK